MKKALVLFLFLCMFVNQTCSAISLIPNQNGLPKKTSQKNKFEEKSSLNDSLIDFVFYKTDIVSDNDNDNEEVEGQKTSTKKNTNTAICYFNSIVGMFYFVEVKVYSKTYSSENNSRLPRFNYISLRVLRL